MLGGARSLAQIARYAADADTQVRAELGLDRAAPNASTLGRLLARIDGDALDDAVGAWLARHAADPVEEDEALIGLAVDGKAVRGSRTDNKTAVHLLAAALHGSQTVIAQRQVTAKSNEIPAMAPLLARFDLRGVVVTADAMHTQRKTAKKIVTAGGHYLLVVKGNQKKLRRQLRRLPWQQMPLLDRTRTAGHGRREVRRLKVCTVEAGLLFPHAVQAIEIKRRRVSTKTGKVQTKTVYAVTSLAPGQAGPARLAERTGPLVRGSPAPRERRGLRRGRLQGPHRQRSPGHGHPAQPRHRPDASGRLDQHRRRSRPLPVTPRPRHRATRSCSLRTHQPWAGMRRGAGRKHESSFWAGTMNLSRVVSCCRFVESQGAALRSDRHRPAGAGPHRVRRRRDRMAIALPGRPRQPGGRGARLPHRMTVVRSTWRDGWT
ncbi:ISAs1 family transposase [Streptomyces sp. NPDC048496]|uniref:ISAs1 family transposase n=1 Tax=Streptomyces sp. NPDC048496 TaxID=3365558 RepID=UPI003718AEE9